jgi:hypothetical protein
MFGLAFAGLKRQASRCDPALLRLTGAAATFVGGFVTLKKFTGCAVDSAISSERCR